MSKLAGLYCASYSNVVRTVSRVEDDEGSSCFTVCCLLYRSIIEPLITYCSICYYPALSVKNRNRLLKISHVSAKIIGLPTPMLSEIIGHAILKKARAVATESDHPLSTFFHVLPSRRRYRCIKCKTSRYSRSFVPVAIRMLIAK